MSLRKKLILGASMVSILSVMMISVSIYELQVLIDDHKMIDQMHRPALNYLIQMKTSLLDATQESFVYVHLNESEEKDDFYSTMNDFDDSLKQYYSIEKNFGMYPDEIQELEQIMIIRNDYMRYAEIMFAYHEKSGNVGVDTARLFEDSKKAIIIKIDDLMNSESNELQVLQDRTISNSTSSMYTIIVMSTVTISLIMISSIIFSRRFIRSISEKIRLEKQLSESHIKIKNEKFATIGELSSRLAHDLKNPLSIIKMNLELLRIHSPNLSEDEKYFSATDRAIDRMSHQIDDVMDFVKIGQLSLDWILVSKMLELVISGINKPESVIIEVKNPDKTLKIQCDAKRVEVLFSNLIMNALQAIGDQGKVTITVNDQGEFVLIQVQDTGCGIPHEIMDRIFEPLFTTKQVGTGLGLASVKNIVEQHGGTISVRNNPTTFEVMLPKKQNQNVS